MKMRLKMISPVVWALLLSQVASRPQQTVPATRTSQVTKHPDEDARSRYRASHIASRNLNEFYNKLYAGGFTPGIMSSIRQSFPPDDMPIHPPSKSILIPRWSPLSIPSSPDQASKSPIIDRVLVSPKRSRNSGRWATTKSPISGKNRVVIKPSIFPSPSFPTKKRPAGVPPSRKVSKPDNTTPEPALSTPNQKTWPNTPPEDILDLYNYEKYTSLLEPSKKPTPASNPSSDLEITTENPKVTVSQLQPAIPTLKPSPNIQEIIQWLQIPPFTSTVNQSYFLADTKPGQSLSNTFSPVFDPNRPLVTQTDPDQTQNYDEEVNDFHFSEAQPSDIPSTLQSSLAPLPPEPAIQGDTLPGLSNEGSANPTVVPKRPLFKPISEISQNTVVHIINPMSKRPNVTVSEGQQNVSTLKPPPNVHIMFMSQANDTKQSLKDSVNQLPFDKTPDCPIITINSITKVNNTIQSKEGCTDLNIVINSQLLSTNNFGPEVIGLDEAGSDKYGDSLNPTDYSTMYVTNPSEGFPSTALASTGPVRDVNGTLEGPSSEPSDSTLSNPNFDVNQATDIEYEVEPEAAGNAAEVLGQLDAAGPQASVADAPGVASAAVRPVAPAAAALEQSSGAVGDPIGPAIASGGTLAAGAPAGPASTALSTVDDEDDDDDDDDDEFDLSPAGIMDGMGSIFTYFTFMNPLNYGIFSFAAAPFAALAAGILGIAAISFPYAFTGSLDFGRSADRVSPKFRSNLEEVVTQSIHDYRNWQEWKSKRRKRRR